MRQVHLTPAEQDRLTVFTVAELAKRRRSRGRLLSAPEVVALVTDAVFEAAWDGLPFDEVVDAGRAAVSREEAMPGVSALVRRVEVDALFPSGTALVAVDDPIGPPESGDPGEVLPASEPVPLNRGRRTLQLPVTNTSDQPVRVSSHFPFDQVNAVLSFDRDQARGTRLDVPAGGSVGWQPGETRRVTLVALGGRASPPTLRLDGGQE